MSDGAWCSGLWLCCGFFMAGQCLSPNGLMQTRGTAPALAPADPAGPAALGACGPGPAQKSSPVFGSVPRPGVRPQGPSLVVCVAGTGQCTLPCDSASSLLAVCVCLSSFITSEECLPQFPLPWRPHWPTPSALPYSGTKEAQVSGMTQFRHPGGMPATPVCHQQHSTSRIQVL